VLGDISTLSDITSTWDAYRSAWSEALVPETHVLEEASGLAQMEGNLDDGNGVNLWVNLPLWVFDLRHEFGHEIHWSALYALYLQHGLKALDGKQFTAQDPVLQAYFKARGITDPIEGHFAGGWTNLAYEAFADTWAVVAFPSDSTAVERTFARNYPLDRGKMLAFYRSLFPHARTATEDLMPKFISQPFPVDTDANGNADAVVALEGLTSGAATFVDVQRVGTTGTEPRMPGLIGQSTGTDAGVRATVRVRGDSILNGRIWLQLFAVQ